MKVMDALGFTLEDAKDRLFAAGIKNIDIKVTAPPKMRGDSYDCSFRVLSLKQIDNDTVELIVAKPL
ncbi:MAG TPA: hypothetical protein VF941_07325 [Clostridia bacterium]